MSNKKVLTGEERKAQLLDAGAKLASKHGAVNVTRRMVAEACRCAEGLVSVYMGDSASAQKAYARRAKALGLTLPDKAKAEAIGAKLRAHGPRDKRDTRKRSPKEIDAIRRKSAAGAATVAIAARAVGSAKVRKEASPRIVKARAAAAAERTKPLVKLPRPTETKPAKPASKPVESPGKAPSPPENKSAARAPKAPPTLPLPPSS